MAMYVVFYEDERATSNKLPQLQVQAVLSVYLIINDLRHNGLPKFGACPFPFYFLVNIRSS